MRVEAFIPCRLGEPITAVKISGQSLYFGSISGYIGKYDSFAKSLDYYPNCLAELVRNLEIDNGALFACVGDQFVSEHDAKTLAKVEDHQWEDFKHRDLICGNYFSYIAKSPRTGKVTAFLSLFPTTEVERLSSLKSA